MPGSNYFLTAFCKRRDLFGESVKRAQIIIGAFPLTDKPSPQGGDCEEDAIDNED